jgi:predicted permease
LDAVDPGYFSTLGVPIVAGREILESDSGNAPRVCVINEAFARRFFDGRNPMGMRVTSVEADDARTTHEVVGVARDAHTQGLRGEVEPRYFVAVAQQPASPRSPTFLIRTATNTAPVMAAVRKAIPLVDASLPILSAETIEERMAPLTAQDRTTARLAVVFGCVALALAAIGLYGVLSHGIARRTGEIAIRIALGARPGRVVSMILGETAGVVGAGLALGGALAYAASRLIDSRLYGVAPQDPLTLALATGLLLLVALGAAYFPARQASRLDPVEALRQA